MRPFVDEELEPFQVNLVSTTHITDTKTKRESDMMLLLSIHCLRRIIISSSSRATLVRQTRTLNFILQLLLSIIFTPTLIASAKGHGKIMWAMPRPAQKHGGILFGNQKEEKTEKEIRQRIGW